MSERPPARRRWLSNDSLLSIAATLLSLCAVVTTVWQTSIMREQLRLSVWPRVRVDMRYFTENEDRFFHIKLENVGVGPAIISSVRFSYRGQDFPHLGEMWRKVMAENKVAMSSLKHNEVSGVQSGEVLA